MGAVAENIVQLAEAMGLNGSWDLPGRAPDYLQFRPAKLPESASLPESHPVFARHTNRFKFSSAALSDRDRQSISGLGEGACMVRLLSDSEEIAAVARLVRMASSLRFRNQQVHEWFGKSLRFRGQSGSDTGLEVSTIDLPAGGELLLRLISDWKRMRFLNRFGMNKLLASIEGVAIKATAGIVVLLGPASDGFDAGRLMERVWLQAERNGLAVQPYYVVSDQLVRLRAGQLPGDLIDQALTLKDAAEKLFGVDAFPHMLLRIGHALTDPPRSKRRPVDEVIVVEKDV
jgi:hypothetical protein